MKKFYISALLALFAGITASADEWCLVVNGADNSTLAIAVAEKPVITTAADGYVVTYGDKTAEFAWAGIKSITMEQTAPNAIKTPAQSALKLEAGEIRLSNAKPGAPVRIYNAAGQLVQQAAVSADGSLSLSTSSLAGNAVYIIKTPSQTIKIKK